MSIRHETNICWSASLGLFVAKILIIDDDEIHCTLLIAAIEQLGHECRYTLSLGDGCRLAAEGSFDVVYLDVNFPDGNGLDKLPVIQQVTSAPEVIIMTGLGDPDGAELAIKNGVWDYIEKQSSLQSMILPLVRALQYREVKKVSAPAAPLKREAIVGKSPRLNACLDQIAAAARVDTSVLISGETGTGKELLAWALHNNSERAGRNLVVVDCGALTESLVEGMLFGHEKGAYTGAEKARDGLIRQADGGTLFLDEVGELPMLIQRSFLRVLQEHSYRPLGSQREIKVDFRLVAATNRDLDGMVARGQFRKDLLYRLRSFHIEVPPLRDRLDDIIDLALYHTRKICERNGSEAKALSADFIEILQGYSWPGNVRELVNTLERCVAVARHELSLIPKHLPMEIRVQVARSHLSGKRDAEPDHSEKDPPPLSTWQSFREDTVFRMEQQYLRDMLSRSQDNIKNACEISGLSRSRLYELLKKHNLTTQTDQPDL